MNSNVVVLENKLTDSSLAYWPGMGKKVVHLTTSELAISLLQPPPRVPQQSWTNLVMSQVFAPAYGLYSAHRLLRRLIEPLLASCEKGLWLAIAMILQQIIAFRPGPGLREAQYRETLRGIFETLSLVTGAFAYTRSNMCERIFRRGHVVVIKNDQLGPDEFCLLANFFANWLFAYRKHTPSACTWPTVLVVEDSTSITLHKRSQDTPGGMTALDHLASVGREFNISLWIVGHDLTQTSKMLLSNLETLIAFAPRRVKDSDLQQLFGLGDEQVRAAKELPRGEALASVPSVWPKSVRLSFPKPPELTESDRTVRRTTQRFWKQVRYTKPEPPETPEAPQ